MEKQERAFLTRLVEGTVERKLTLEYMIDQVSKTPVRKMKPVIRCIMRMAANQIFYMDAVPDSAACNEAVKLAQKKGFQTLKGFVYTLMVLAIIPVLVVIEDLGTAIAIAGALVCMMIAAEVPWKYLLGTMGIGFAGVVAMIAVKPYRIKRILVWLDPFSDPLQNP